MYRRAPRITHRVLYVAGACHHIDTYREMYVVFCLCLARIGTVRSASHELSVHVWRHALQGPLSLLVHVLFVETRPWRMCGMLYRCAVRYIEGPTQVFSVLLLSCPICPVYVSLCLKTLAGEGLAQASLGRNKRMEACVVRDVAHTVVYDHRDFKSRLPVAMG